MKAYNQAEKLQQCKRVITDLLQACGPCDIHWITREVKAQAIAPGMQAKAMMELSRSLTIKFDAEEQALEMVQ